jgi:hypothetical protein
MKLPLLTRTGGPDILVTKAFGDVAKERQRQIFEEGWTAKHDDQENKNGELQSAAAAYALPLGFLEYTAAMWPWPVKWYKPTTPRRDLVKAAALIIAAIEQIDRKEAVDK